MSHDNEFFSPFSLSRFSPQGNTGENGDDPSNPLSTLMRAVLIKAIEDFQKGGQLRRDVLRYLHENHSEFDDHVFSFNSICEALQLDPQSVRSSIFGLTKPVRFRRRVAAN